MSEYDNTNTVVLFKNESDNEKAPVLTGKVNIEGTEYPIALWTRTSTRSGEKFWSGKVEIDKVPAAAGATDDSDDFPF